MSRKQIMPPTYFLIYLILPIIVTFIYPVGKIIGFLYNLIGVLLILIGIVLNIWADRIFKDINTTVKPFGRPSKLTKDGPFNLSRNPMYLGMFLIILGTSIICKAYAALIFPFLFLITMNRKFIPLEEKNLQEAFGEEFITYKKHVRRWI